MLSRSSRHIADRDLKVLGLSVNKSPSTKSVQFSATTFASTSIAGSPLPESQTRDPYTSWLDFDDDDLDDDGGDHGADGGDTAELDVLSSDDIKKTSLQISFNTKHPRLVTFLTVAGDVQHALVQALLGFELEPSLSLQDFGLVPDRTSTPGTVKLFGDPLSESTSAAVTFALCQIPERHATPPPPYEARMPDTKTWGNLPAWEIADEQNVCSLKNHQFNDIDDSLCSAFRHSPGASLCQMSNTLVLTIDDSPASRLSAMTTLLQVAELNAPDGVPEADASLPSAIVVMTATRTPVELEAWDPDFTTDTFFDQMLLSDVSLTSLKDRVRRRFLHFRVLRIPNFGSSLRKTQIDKLWAEIHNNCGQALPYFPTQPKDATTMQFEPAEPEGLVLGGRALSLSESCTTDILRLSILDSIERRLGCGLALMVDLIIAVGVAEAIAVSMTQGKTLRDIVHSLISNDILNNSHATRLETDPYGALIPSSRLLNDTTVGVTVALRQQLMTATHVQPSYRLKKLVVTRDLPTKSKSKSRVKFEENLSEERVTQQSHAHRMRIRNSSLFPRLRKIASSPQLRPGSNDTIARPQSPSSQSLYSKGSPSNNINTFKISDNERRKHWPNTEHLDLDMFLTSASMDHDFPKWATTRQSDTGTERVEFSSSYSCATVSPPSTSPERLRKPRDVLRMALKPEFCHKGMCTSEHYEDAVRACLNDPVALRIIGDLVARRFFLEIRGFSCFSNGVAMCSGHIECRARNGSEELRVLGSFFRCIAARATPCFIVAPTNDNMTHFKVPLSQDVIDQMADHGRFNLNSICVPTQPETCKLFLSMVFGGSHDEYEDMYEVCSAVPTSFSTDCAPDPPEKDHKRRTPLMNAPVEEN